MHSALARPSLPSLFLVFPSSSPYAASLSFGYSASGISLLDCRSSLNRVLNTNILPDKLDGLLAFSGKKRKKLETDVNKKIKNEYRFLIILSYEMLTI